jgi:transcriptional regulator with XRE-family HTH domain
MEHENGRKHIPNRLRKHRRVKRLKQFEVAYLLGINGASQVSRWEQGEAMPSAENLLKLYIIYGSLIEEMYFDLIQEYREDIERKSKKKK